MLFLLCCCSEYWSKPVRRRGQEDISKGVLGIAKYTAAHISFPQAMAIYLVKQACGNDKRAFV